MPTEGPARPTRGPTPVKRPFMPPLLHDIMEHDAISRQSGWAKSIYVTTINNPPTSSVLSKTQR